MAIDRLLPIAMIQNEFSGDVTDIDEDMGGFDTSDYKRSVLSGDAWNKRSDPRIDFFGVEWGDAHNHARQARC
jgi:hypothetical protein